eukprot:186547_1
MVVGNETSTTCHCTMKVILRYAIIIFCSLMGAASAYLITTIALTEDPYECGFHMRKELEHGGHPWTMYMNTWGIIGCLMVIITSLLAIIISCQQGCLFSCCLADKTRKRLAAITNIAYLILLSIFGLIWCIIGFVIYSQLTKDCLGTEQATMLLVWCVLAMVWSPMFVVLGCFAINLMRKGDQLKEQFLSNA